ncbi:MAG: hypothetical protein NUW37_02845 [Planctomycetes bacterium]|nr:hypothetical protein [Planctomycetota bacterium]
MSEEKTFTIAQAHKFFGANCFNETWTLIEKKDRTAEEDELMVHTTHASFYHWSKHGEPVNFARGNWQLARVYSILGRGEPALRYAKLSLDICVRNRIEDFDLAFGYEAVARAYAVLGNSDAAKDFLSKAKDAGQKIKDKDDRDYFFNDLASEPKIVGNAK